MRAAIFVCALSALAQTLTPPESAAVAAIDRNAPASINLLERLVNINSGTFNPPGVIATGKLLEPEFQALGFTTRWINMDAVNRAPSLVAERKGTRGKRVLLIGHLDTVFEPSSPFQKWERQGNRAIAPGGSDMKGGIIVILEALRGLHAAGALEGSTITVFLTGDEENAGRPISVSRKDLIEAGKNSDAALCFEGGSRRDGRDYISVARRGSTNWEIRVTAQTGHSSGVFSERAGHGAIFELSRILTAFHDTLREANMTFSVGLSAGGENLKATPGGEASVTGKSNIIPESAMARGDLRVLSPEQYDRVTTKMHSIVANNNLPGTHSEIVIDQGYPAMAPTEGNRALFNLRNEANRALGFAEELELNPMDRGAGDVSFVAPYVDSLSGLGANGSGSHAPGEAVELDTLPRQAKRAAVLIHRLIQAPRGR